MRYYFNPKKIKGLMALHGKTQADIAEVLELSYTSTSLKMKGQRDFKADEVCKVANFFHVKPDIFFDPIVDKTETKSDNVR